MTETTAGPASAEQLRLQLAAKLVDRGIITDGPLRDAVERVPRHLFAPGVDLAKAYEAEATLLHLKDAHGATVSSVSAATIQAMMLRQARLGPGMRVLEIGSGGYNAALIAQVVGDQGQVTSIDIDPEVIVRAQRCLAEAGYGHVQAAITDGEYGWPDAAPYDRIIVTVGAWDIPPAWIDQLAADGVLVAPLRMNGLTRSVALVRDGDTLVAESAQVCGFVPMRGDGAHAEHLLTFRDKEIGLRFDDRVPDGVDTLATVFDGPRIERWSGITVGRSEPFDTLHLWQATTLDGFGLLSVDRSQDTGVVQPQNTMACPATAGPGGVAYLALRRLGAETFEFGAHGFGPERADLADALIDNITTWDRSARRGPDPRITARPAADAGRPADGVQIDKRHMSLTISWPE